MIHYLKIAKSISCTLLSILFLSNSSMAQDPTSAQADPRAASVSLIGGGSTINQRGTIRYILQNASSAAPGDDGWIHANAVELTIGFPNEYGLEPNVVPVIAGYTVVYYVTGPGGNIHLRNTQELDATESLPAEIPVVGFVATANYENTTLNVSTVYNPPLTCGNTNPLNDNASASISVAQPLPVRLLNFSAKADACNTVLNWSVAKEDNFSHYNIAYAKDGVHFSNVGKVAGGKRNYTFSYAQPAGEGFYKIQMVDRDGTFSESKVVTVITDCRSSKILVYPNPAKDVIHVEGAAEGSVIYVMNMTGQTVAMRKVNATSVQAIKMEGWAVGNYNVVVVHGSDKQVTTVAKQ